MEQKSTMNTQETDDNISLKELILKLREWVGYLLSKWLIVLVCGILGGALGFTYALYKKPVYIASTTFVLEEGEKSGGLGQYAGIASMVGIDLGGGGGGIFQGDNILELYKSRSMIVKTLLTSINNDGKDQLLIDQYISFNKLREKWSSEPALKNIQFKTYNIKDSKTKSLQFTRLQDSILGTIVNDINSNYLIVAKLDKKLSIIKADVKSLDESFAIGFNNQIVKNVNDFYIQTKTKKALDNVSILQQKTDSVRSVMNGAIYSSAVVSDATPNLNPTKQVQRIAPMQRSQFTAETNKLVLGELVKNLEMSKIALRKETPLIQVVDQPVLPLYVDKLGKLKGLVLGAFALSFFSVLFLLIKRIYKNLMR
jgi:hypothetical protein